MARQDVVRALVPEPRVEDVVAGLHDRFALEQGDVEVEEARPGTYRDEKPDLELRALVRAGRVRVLLAIVAGALLGGGLAAAIPMLRAWAPVSIALLAFGGAWGLAAVVAARTVQVHRDEGDRPEKLHEFDARQAARMRVVTVRSLHERPAIADHLADQGIVLLDSLHPRVGGRAPGARPADPGGSTGGPPAT